MRIYFNYKGAGVYAIINNETGKRYIGSSKNVNKRLHEHLYYLKKGKHYNKELLNDYKKGNKFDVELIMKIPCDLTEELVKNEMECIRIAKNNNIPLYNKAELKDTPYESISHIVRYMANEYCKEKLGMTLSHMLNRCEAGYTMLYQIMRNPDKEKEIRKKYESAIDFQNKDKFYRRSFNISYCEYMNLPEEKQKKLMEFMIRRNRYA